MPRFSQIENLREALKQLWLALNKYRYRYRYGTFFKRKCLKLDGAGIYRYGTYINYRNVVYSTYFSVADPGCFIPDHTLKEGLKIKK
jgi:hypothetical protein